jgi:hypothetical protein
MYILFSLYQVDLICSHGLLSISFACQIRVQLTSLWDSLFGSIDCRIRDLSCVFALSSLASKDERSLMINTFIFIKFDFNWNDNWNMLLLVCVNTLIESTITLSKHIVNEVLEFNQKLRNRDMKQALRPVI